MVTTKKYEIKIKQITIKTLIQDSTGEFDWDSEEQGVILGAFYYGYIATQVNTIVITKKLNFDD